MHRSFCGHRACDVDELTEFVAVPTQPLASALGALLGLEQLEGADTCQEDLVDGRLLGDDARQAAVHRLLQVDVAWTSHQDEHRGRVGETPGERLEELAPAIPNRRWCKHDHELVARDGDEQGVRT